MQARNGKPYDRALKQASEQDPGRQVLYGMEFTTGQMFVERGKVYLYAGRTDEAMKAYAEIINLDTLAVRKPFQAILPEPWRIQTILDMSRATLSGPAKDMRETIRYWKAALEGAKRLKSEGFCDGALDRWLVGVEHIPCPLPDCGIFDTQFTDCSPNLPETQKMKMHSYP
jgi:hypothetical protein